MKKTIATVSLAALLLGATSAFAATTNQDTKAKMAPAATGTEKGKAKHKGKGKAKAKSEPAATTPTGK